jgi:hypothetical protein
VLLRLLVWVLRLLVNLPQVVHHLLLVVWLAGLHLQVVLMVLLHPGVQIFLLLGEAQ